MTLCNDGTYSAPLSQKLYLYKYDSIVMLKYSFEGAGQLQYKVRQVSMTNSCFEGNCNVLKEKCGKVSSHWLPHARYHYFGLGVSMDLCSEFHEVLLFNFYFKMFLTRKVAQSYTCRCMMRKSCVICGFMNLVNDLGTTV